MLLTLNRALIEYHGTTGVQSARCFRNLFTRKLGPQWSPTLLVLVTETIATAPAGLPKYWQFGAIGDAYDQCYHNREDYPIPDHVKSLPPEAWQDITDGAGKQPSAAAVAYALHAPTLNEFRRLGWERLGDVARLHAECRACFEQVDISPNPPFVILVGAAGGGTGPAGLLNGTRFWCSHGSRPHVLVFAIGPECGQGVGEVERAIATRLLASLYTISQQTSRLWVFWLDGPAYRREFLLSETAEFLFSLVVGSKDQDNQNIPNMRRLLHDGFSKARQKFGGCICRVDFAWLGIAPNLKQQACEDMVYEALKQLIGGEDGESV